MAEEQKLHIDDDWKSQAQQEKERLTQEVEKVPGKPHEQAGALPEADFRGLVNLLAMQAIVGLGGLREPGGPPIPPNPELAKHHIDLLETLEKKTKGNLDEAEQQLLDTTLYQLRMAYVQFMAPEPPAPRSGTPAAP